MNFADIIGRSMLDYRVILISRHGRAADDQSICITKPLPGNPTCSPPPPVPFDTARFFHYDTEVNSTNSLDLLLLTYKQGDVHGHAPGGWSDWVREGTLKVFIEITDDNAWLSDSEFDRRLLALNPARFGTVAKRDYVFHTIAGLKENNPATAPWQPVDPLQTAKCSRGGGAMNYGANYQRLSKTTLGLRFPICEYQSFDAIFQSVAQGVVVGAGISCDFKIPVPPFGQEVDPNSALVEYQPGGMGPARSLTKVAGADQCAPGAFYLSGDHVSLCPDTCAEIQRDPAARVQVLLDCRIG